MTGRGYEHDALFCDSDEALLASAVPFLTAGLDAGETVVLVCTEGNTATLLDAMDGDPRIRPLPQDAFYHNAIEAVDAYTDLMQRHPGTGRVRLVGEVAFGSDPEGRSQWTRFESLCNHVLAPYPLWSVCAYDKRLVAPQIVESAWLTHPHVLEGAVRRPNHRYVAAEQLLRGAQVGPDPVEDSTPTLETAVGPELRPVRSAVRAAALDGEALGRRRVDDFVAAVSEVVTNAQRHGHPPVLLRLWVTADRIVCTVTDEGAGIDDPLVGYRSTTLEPLAGASGLWLARRLVDRLELAPGPTGFTVRIVTRR